MQFNRLIPEFVDDMPGRLTPGVLYVSIRYKTAMHLCCCGCGSEIVTPFSPAQWRMTFDGESISLHPSVGNWNLPCRSHYIIRDGRVIEADTWSDKEVSSGQARDRRAREAHYDSKRLSPQLEVVKEPAAALPSKQGRCARLWHYLISKC